MTSQNKSLKAACLLRALLPERSSRRARRRQAQNRVRKGVAIAGTNKHEVPGIVITSMFERKSVLRRRAEVLSPVVMRLGNYGDDVLDLLFRAEGRPGRQKQHVSFASHTDIFHHNGSQQPERHLLIRTGHANPAQALTAYCRQPCDQLEATLNLGNYPLVGLLIRPHFLWSDRFEERSSM